MADKVKTEDVDGEVMLQRVVDALFLSSGLLTLELCRRDRDGGPEGRTMQLHLLMLQLQHVVEQACDIAGLERDGSFRPVPPTKPKRGAR